MVVSFSRISDRSRKVLTFAAVWTLGLLLGSLLAEKADTSFLSQMPAALGSRPSIVLVLLTAALPFWIAAYAVFIDRYLILFVACFVKALAFSMCAGILFRVFGSAGWLLQPMLQFTDTVCCVVFCWFCIRRCSGEEGRRKDLMVGLIVCAVAAVLDLTVVSPFLEALS